MPNNEYECQYCGYDGGFHGCHGEVSAIIQNYIKGKRVLDADELADLIGAAGYFQTREERKNAYI